MWSLIVTILESLYSLREKLLLEAPRRRNPSVVYDYMYVCTRHETDETLLLYTVHIQSSGILILLKHMQPTIELPGANY